MFEDINLVTYTTYSNCKQLNTKHMSIEISLFAVLIILLVINFVLVNLLNWAFRYFDDSHTITVPLVLTMLWFLLNSVAVDLLISKKQQKPSLLIKTEIVDSIQYYSLIKDDKVYDFITIHEVDSIKSNHK